MEGFNTYEYSAEQKPTGKWLLLRLFFLLFYTLFATAYFLVIYVTRFFPVGALIPVAVWILVFLTWRYTRPDYKYEISSGALRFFVTYKKKPQEKLKIKISEAEAIIPIDTEGDKLRDFSPRKIYTAVPSKNSTDVYAVLFYNEKGKRCAFLFVATEEAIRLLAIYNSKTVKM